MKKFILQFNFETGDNSCKYYQVYVVVESKDTPDYDTLEDSISSYFESSSCDEDSEYEDNVEDIMNQSGMPWSFMKNGVPVSETIFSFWI